MLASYSVIFGNAYDMVCCLIARHSERAILLNGKSFSFLFSKIIVSSGSASVVVHITFDFVVRESYCKF